MVNPVDEENSSSNNSKSERDDEEPDSLTDRLLNTDWLVSLLLYYYYLSVVFVNLYNYTSLLRRTHLLQRFMCPPTARLLAQVPLEINISFFQLFGFSFMFFFVFLFLKTFHLFQLFYLNKMLFMLIHQVLDKSTRVFRW